MRRGSHRRIENSLSFLLAGLLGLSGGSLAPVAHAGEPGAQGALKADTGFRPDPNGFSFPNWGGDERPRGDLTADDVRCLFGDKVCARVAGGRCEPSPAARMWIEEMNKGMEGGHCEGLAALSAAFFAGQRQPQAYGGQTAMALKDANAALLRTISTIFVTQFLEPVKSTTDQTKRLSTREIVDTLVRAMQSRQEMYTLGIYGNEGGHAITPYAVEETGHGRYLIHVYDNNYPGVGNVVEVDTGADRWRYAAAALNPSEAAAPWEGTSGAMDLTPLSVRFTPLECPFCAPGPSGPMCAGAPSAQGPGQPAAPPAARSPAPPAPTAVVTSANCDQVAVADKKSGRRAAFAQGKATSQIPGVEVTRRRGSRGCVIELPPGTDYDVSVAGRPGQPPQPLDTLVVRPGQVVSLDGSEVTAGHVESMGIGDSSFTYRPGSDAKPTFEMATDNASGPDGYYKVDHLELGAGHSFEIDENEEGQITFDSDDPGLHTLDIAVRLEDEHGTREVDFDDVEFDDQGQAILGSDGHGGLVYGMDTDSDGQINAQDPDDDNDGQPDASDPDDDNDGTPDARERQVEDADGDGTPDEADADDDNDGTADAADKDDDNDGTPDDQEEHQDDADGDGTPDEADADDDNDGAPDEQEEPADEPEDPPPGDEEDDTAPTA